MSWIRITSISWISNFQQLSARSLRFVETKFLRWPCIARGFHFGEPRGHQVPPLCRNGAVAVDGFCPQSWIQLLMAWQDVAADAIGPGCCHQHWLCRAVAQRNRRNRRNRRRCSIESISGFGSVLHWILWWDPYLPFWIGLSRRSPLQTSLEPKSCGFAQWKNRTSKSRAKQGSGRNSKEFIFWGFGALSHPI